MVHSCGHVILHWGPTRSYLKDWTEVDCRVLTHFSCGGYDGQKRLLNFGEGKLAAVFARLRCSM